MNTLSIINLSVSVSGNPIVHNLCLDLQPGTIHILMGPNGSGKSTLAATIMGHPSYQITQGSISLGDALITDLAVEKRAHLGIFLASQQPPEIPGVNIFIFLKESYTALSGTKIGVKDFQALVTQALEFLGLAQSFVQRNLNEGFSGGEKKRLELLQLLLFKPKLAILDEIDSGLDVDALQLVAKVISMLRAQNPSMIVLLITHYQKIIDQLMPDAVHVMQHGKIVRSGTNALALQIQEQGYESIG